MTFDDVNLLLSWYRENKRDFPWRNQVTPYRVYVSEIRLQQTRADTVIPYFNRFTEAFKNRFDFVLAKEDVYLKLWEGLGYYSRVKNRHKARKRLYDEQKEIPSSPKELILLPGIGEYTSKSIASIAFQYPCVAVDGNLFRVFSRLTRTPSFFSPSSKKECEDFYLPLLPSLSGDFNQALMDLGERICIPKGAPKCSLCPLSSCCLAHLRKKEMDFPLPKPKPRKKEENPILYFVVYQNRLLLSKRSGKGLLSSLYGPIDVTDRKPKERESFLLSLGCRDSLKLLGTYRHIFSHRVWNRKAYWIEATEKPALKDNEVLASAEDIKNLYSIPSAFAPFISLLKEKDILY